MPVWHNESSYDKDTFIHPLTQTFQAVLNRYPVKSNIFISLEK